MIFTCSYMSIELRTFVLSLQEEDLIKSEDPKHQHLKETLHVKINVEAPSNEAHLIMTHAISEVKRYMNPVSYSFTQL